MVVRLLAQQPVGYNETASDAAQATPDNMVHTYTIKDDDDPPVLKYSQSFERK